MIVYTSAAIDISLVQDNDTRATCIHDTAGWNGVMIPDMVHKYITNEGLQLDSQKRMESNRLYLMNHQEAYKPARMSSGIRSRPAMLCFGIQPRSPAGAVSQPTLEHTLKQVSASMST